MPATCWVMPCARAPGSILPNCGGWRTRSPARRACSARWTPSQSAGRACTPSPPPSSPTRTSSPPSTLASTTTGSCARTPRPLLRQLRRQAQEQREALLRRLESLLRDSGGAAADSFVTLRGDRFVIPVRADHGGAVRGIVHDRSASGATLFVEPLEVLDANNELQRLRDAEQREIQRLLGELTARVAAVAASALQGLDALEAVDSLQARARWGHALGASTPRRQGPLRLHGARHPLLETQLRARGGAAVPLDLELGDARALVLTGPNAGGKTVALKTIGLLALLHQAGIPVPARGRQHAPGVRERGGRHR